MRMKFVLEIISVYAIICYANSEQLINDLDHSSNVRCWSRRGQFPHLIYCDWFYNCWDGSVYEQKCPKGLVFNVNIRGCDYPDNVDCVSRLTSWEVTSDKWVCPKPFGSFADVTNCSMFVMCVGGTPIPQACPPTLYFNPSSNVCDYPYNVIAPNCKTHPPTGSFNCPVPNGVFGHMTDCDKFWICENFIAILMFCPFGTFFDVRYSTCLEPDQVQCGGQLYDFVEGPDVFLSQSAASSQLVSTSSLDSNNNSTENRLQKNSLNNSTSL